MVNRGFGDDDPERHDVVGRGERIRIAQVDLLLARCALVVAEFHRDAHRLQRADRRAAEVVPDAVRGMVEVSVLVDRDGLGSLHVGPLEEEELDLRVRVEGEAEVRRASQAPLEDEPRVGEGRRTVRQQNVREQPPGSPRLAAPGQHLEGRRVGADDHVRLRHAGEAFDRRAVEADPLRERALQFRRCHGHRLQPAKDVREPQSDEPDVALLDGAEHVLGLLVHASILPAARCRGERGTRKVPVRRRSAPSGHPSLRCAHTSTRAGPGEPDGWRPDGQRRNRPRLRATGRSGRGGPDCVPRDGAHRLPGGGPRAAPVVPAGESCGHRAAGG